jgi:putrescine transport system substrate-binding protein
MADLDPDSRPTPPPLSRRLRSIPLAAILSVALASMWVAYLVVAPVPVPPPPLQATPAPTADALPLLPDQMRILIWRDVLGPDALAAFEAESDIQVSVERYSSFQDLMVIIDSGLLTHDMVITSGIGVPLMIERGLLQPLSVEQLLSAAGLDETVLARAARYDAGNTHSLPLLWGTIGLAFDRVKFAERVEVAIKPESWSLLFDPASAATLADCGIQVINSPDGVFPIALMYLKLAHDSVAVEDTDAAARLWESVRPSISKFTANDVVGGLARGEVCMAMTTSGDAYQAAASSRALGEARNIAYIIPSEGAVLWHVLASVPAMASHPEHASELMDYLVRPEVAARITNATGFVSAVKDAALYVKPEIKNDPAFNPDIDNLPNVVPETSPGPVGISLRDKFWQLINALPEQPTAPN